MTPRREIPDGCLACGLSRVACDASQYVDNVECCETCIHREEA